MLRKLEAFAFFLALMLAVILEGAVVYWMFQHPLLSAGAHSSLNVQGQWSSAALPQAWLCGALLVLAYRVTVLLLPPTKWTNDEIQRNRNAFVRLWLWTMAVIAVQGLVLFLGNATPL